MDIPESVISAIRNSVSPNPEQIVQELREAYSNTPLNDPCIVREPLTISALADLCSVKDPRVLEAQRNQILEGLPQPRQNPPDKEPRNTDAFFQQLDEVDFSKLDPDILDDESRRILSCMGELADFAKSQEQKSSNIDDLVDLQGVYEEMLYLLRLSHMIYIRIAVQYQALADSNTLLENIESINEAFDEEVLQQLPVTDDDATQSEISFQRVIIQTLEDLLRSVDAVEAPEKSNADVQGLVGDISDIIEGFNNSESLESESFYTTIEVPNNIPTPAQDFERGDSGYYHGPYLDSLYKEPGEDVDVLVFVDQTLKRKFSARQELQTELETISSSDQVARVARTLAEEAFLNGAFNEGDVLNAHQEFLDKSEILLQQIFDIQAQVEDITSVEPLIEKLQSLSCGAGIDISDVQAQIQNQDEPEDPNEGTGVEEKGFDADNKPTLTELDYWKIYSKYITLVNLLPIYWTIGLILPSPGGPIRVPLPTIWKPILVFYTPLGLIVVFITINGILVIPSVWMLMNRPLADNEARHLVLFRNFNVSIRSDVKVQVPIPYTPEGIDPSPLISQGLPITDDPLPTVKRMSLANLPWLVFLNEWVKQAITGLGFP